MRTLELQIPDDVVARIEAECEMIDGLLDADVPAAATASQGACRALSSTRLTCSQSRRLGTDDNPGEREAMPRLTPLCEQRHHDLHMGGKTLRLRDSHWISRHGLGPTDH